MNSDQMETGCGSNQWDGNFAWKTKTTKWSAQRYHLYYISVLSVTELLIPHILYITMSSSFKNRVLALLN